MNLQVEPLENHEVRITITVDDDAVTKARRAVLRDLSKQVKIPGFRPGHAPESTVISSVGADYFESELANKVAGDVYPKALDEAKIEPYGPGSIEDVKKEPFQLIVKVPLEPSVDLKDYASIRLPFPEIAVTDEEIEQQIQAIREDNAIVEKVDRPAQLGDLVEGSIAGHDEETGEDVFQSNSKRGFVLDEERMGIPGLAALIVGMSAGDHEHKALVFPSDFATEALRDKKVEVHLEINKVSSRVLPEADDSLAQTVGSFDTLAALRDDLRKRILEHKTQQANRDYANQALDAFAAAAEVKMPPAFLADRLNDLMTDIKQDIRDEEGIPFDEWLKLQNKTEEQFREDYKDTARQRAVRGLVMRELATAERVQVTDNEMAAEVEYTVQRYGNREKEVRRLLQQDDTLSTVKNNLLSNKVLSRIVAIAKGEAEKPAQAAPASETPEVEASADEAPTELGT